MEIRDHEEITRRLHALGQQPVDRAVAERHASYLAAATPSTRRSRMRPLMAGSLLAGALLGGTGLAAALPGSLPEQAGSVAKSALEAVNLVQDADEPKDPAKEAAKAQRKAAQAQAKAAKVAGGQGVARFTQGCTTGNPPVPFTGNHGQYVKAHPDLASTPDVNEREVAAQSNCGKPLVAVTNQANAGSQRQTNPSQSNKPEDAGRPASPGKSEETHPPTSAAGAQSQTSAPGNSGSAGKPEDAGTTTTTAATTTTTASTTTTTTTTTTP